MHELTSAAVALMVCVAAGSYLAGCCNGAIITSYLFYKDDIRRHGSHNAGLTNFYRVYGGKFVALVILVDMLKAFVAVKLGSVVFDAYLGLRLEGEYFSALFCVIGHIFPAFYSFKGGKGIAATAGLILAIHPAFIPMGVILFFGTFLLTHYVSLGSLLVYAGFLIEMVIMGQMDLFSMPVGHRIEMYVIAAFLTAMAYWKHRENIKRLLSGTERKTYLFKKNKEALN